MYLNTLPTTNIKKQQSQSPPTPLPNFVNTMKMGSHAPLDPVVLHWPAPVMSSKPGLRGGNNSIHAFMNYRYLNILYTWWMHFQVPPKIKISLSLPTSLLNCVLAWKHTTIDEIQLTPFTSNFAPSWWHVPRAQVVCGKDAFMSYIDYTLPHSSQLNNRCLKMMIQLVFLCTQVW